MKGTERQIKWAKDIKKQVMDAAQMIYDHNEGTGAYYQISFEDSKIGHTATFAIDHMDNAKFWIDSIGYRIIDWKKQDESLRSIIDLENIIYRMRTRFMDYDYSLSDQFFAEEKELEPIRKASMKAWRENNKAKDAAKRAEKENQAVETESTTATATDETTSTASDTSTAEKPAVEDPSTDAPADLTSTATAEPLEVSAVDETPAMDETSSETETKETTAQQNERKNKMQKIKVMYECGVPRGDTVKTAAGGIASSYARDEEGYKVWRPADYMLVVCPNEYGEQVELYAEFLADDRLQDANYDVLRNEILEQAEMKSVNPDMLIFPHDMPTVQDILKDVDKMEDAIFDQLGPEEAFHAVTRALDYGEKESIYHRIIDAYNIGIDGNNNE